MTVNDLLTVIATKTYIGYPVVDEKKELVGVVTIEEATKVDKDRRGKTTVGTIARLNLEVCYPGETALDVVRKMGKLETGRVLVLDIQDPKKILGIITKRDIMHALVKETSESVL
jgi:CIC family chloride channel protein